MMIGDKVYLVYAGFETARVIAVYDTPSKAERLVQEQMDIWLKIYWREWEIK